MGREGIAIGLTGMALGLTMVGLDYVADNQLNTVLGYGGIILTVASVGLTVLDNSRCNFIENDLYGRSRGMYENL